VYVQDECKIGDNSEAQKIGKFLFLEILMVVSGSVSSGEGISIVTTV
jgi:hypothetical protein